MIAPVTPIDLSDAISLAQAAELLAVAGKRPHIKTIYRWASPKRGYRCRRTGVCVVLQTVPLGNETLTTRKWVEAFRQAQLRAGEVEQKKKEVTSRSRKASQRRATEFLDRQGVGKN